MRILGIGLRDVVLCLFILVSSLLTGRAAVAQVVSTSPGSLAFGVPHNSTVSAEQLITITVTGGGSATLSGFVPPANTDFVISSNTCPSAAITSPGSCAVGLTFTPSAAEGTLESSALTFSTNLTAQPTVTVPLSGALGAIKLFDETNLAASNPSASSSNPFNYGSKTINLSCTGDSVTALFSNTPDGLGNVLEDNFLSVAVGAAPATNVCPAGISDPVNDCFTHAYQNYAGGGQHNGVNTDSITNSNDITGGPGGVPPIDISSLFTFGGTKTPVSFTLFDEGGIVAGSTLFLKTNCTPDGITQGGSITGNPVDPGNPASLTPQFPFSTTQGNNIVFSANYTGTSGSENSPATPTVTDVGIRQSDFAAFVVGTHAAPAVCLRLNAETDPAHPGEILCKGFLIECTTASSNTPSGSNCPQSAMDNLKFQAKFDSPDAPIPTGLTPNNYLPDGADATGSACSNIPVPSGAVCAHGTGPGLLEGNDAWVSAVSCVFPMGDPLHGSACPQNPITAFRGAEDPGHTVTTKNTNSLFIPVVNMPLPTDAVVVTGQNTAGWVKGTNSVPVVITANPAAYAPASNNPMGNGFLPVGIQTETYGFAPFTATIPDPDGGPVSGDTVKSNGACPAALTPFIVTDTLSLPDGIYNLHHFPTDCASTEGLRYQPTVSQLTDPSANWASFPVTVVGVDTAAPTFTCGSPSGTLGTGGYYTTNVTVTCTVTDPGYTANVSASGFSPAVNGIQGSPTKTAVLSTNVTPGTITTTATTVPVTVCDLAGNCVILPAMGPFSVDLLGSADLVMVAGGPGSAETGDTVRYTIVASNFGPNAAQGVTLTDILPPGLSFVKGSFTTGFTSGTCANASGTVTCNIGNLATLNHGGIIFAQIVAKVTAKPSKSGTIITNTITIGGLNPDPNLSNNSVTIKTKVTAD